jgi:hypothetical protein
VAIWVFSWSRGILGRILSQRWAVYLGEISFAFYLVHQMIQTRVRVFGEGLPLSPTIAFWSCLLLALAASALLYAVVEVPCKEFLLSLADRRPKRAIRALAGGPIRLWRGGLGVAVVGLSAFAVLMLQQEKAERISMCSDPTAVREILASSSPEFRGIEFENEARLHGLKAEPVADGLRVRMVWEVFAKHRRARFIHICDAAGQVLRHVPRGVDPFAQAVAGQFIVDEVIVHDAALQGAERLSIGFFSPELKAARVDRGPRSMGNHRLDVIEVREARNPEIGTKLR